MKSTLRIHLARPAAAAVLLAAFPLATIAVSTSSPTPSATATPAAEPDATPNPPAIASLSAAVQATRLATLKTRGDAEINRRITDLTAALAKVQAVTTLTASDKSTLVSQIQTEVSGLNALKSKLDADTTLAAARTDVQSIVADFRVYVLMLPKAPLPAAFDSLAVVQTKLTALETQLQTAINNAKAAGKNVTAMQAGLTDMQAKTAALTKT